MSRHPNDHALIRLQVNGEETQVAFAPYKTLLEVIREDLNLTGTKHGCELGECGACAVLLDGEPVLSCLTLGLACDGRAIRTVEGMADGSRLHPLQAAFADLGGSQCGYCTSGMLLTAQAFLDAQSHADPRRDPRGPVGKHLPLHGLSTDLRRGRGGSGGDARRARGRAGRAEGTAPMKRPGVIGFPRRRVDGRAKATGQTRYADDLFLPRMVFAKLLRSPHAHARIVSIDATRVKAHPGVLLVLTGADLPISYGILPVSQDEHALCPDKVRFVGDPVALVVARDELTATEALDLVRRRLRAADDDRRPRGRAGDPRAPHPRLRRRGQHPQTGLDAVRRRRRGACGVGPRLRGRLLLRGQHAPRARAARDGGLPGRRRQAGRRLQHADAALPAPRAREGAGHAGAAHPRDRGAQRRRLRRQERSFQSRDRRREGGAAARSPGEDRADARRGLLLPSRPPSRDHEVPHRRQRRRHADRRCTCRPSSTAAPTARYGVASTFYTGALQTVTYHVPRYKFEGCRVFTNKPPCGPKRGHGTPQSRFGQEVQIDKIAERLAVDPADFRLRIVEQPRHGDGQLHARVHDRPGGVHPARRGSVRLADAHAQAAARAAGLASPARRTSPARACRSTGTTCRIRRCS